MADFLCLLCGSDLACADSPDRLISDNHGSSLLSSNADQIALELQTDPVDGHVCFALLKGLAAAKDRDETILESLEDFSVQESIILFVVISSLRVADDDVLDACIFEHCAGDLAGKCAAVLVRDILCAYSNIGALDSLNNGNDVDCRYAVNDINVIILYQGSKELDKRLCLRGSLVHFPVTGYDFPSCHFLFS